MNVCGRSESGSKYDNFKNDSSSLRDRAKNDIYHDISIMYWARYVLVDQALCGGGMRSTECPSSSEYKMPHGTL